MKDGYMLQHGRALEQGSDDLRVYKNAYLYPNCGQTIQFRRELLVSIVVMGTKTMIMKANIY